MLIQGDCIEKLKELEEKSVDCLVTSPPYWALRDYGVKGQLGLEPTFQEYINKLCDIFDEVKRVLKDEGTCWVNIGDTYSATRWTGNGKGQPMNKFKDGHRDINPAKKSGLEDKTLCGIPARFMIEMINRGWICRNEIIWHKPNCMPSSVKDRFTVDFEKIFFFTKSKKYYFETQYEPLSESSLKDFNARKTFRNKGSNNVYACPGEGRDRREFYRPELGRNKRCVWKVTTKPFKEAHFATYPEKLIEPMIKAGCPAGGIVLDPFFGAGTTGVVAKKQGKDFIGIELNEEYIKIAEKRIKSIPKTLFT